MPELPEVETIARALRQGGRGAAPVLGARIIAVQVLWPRSVAEPSPAGLATQVVDATVAGVARRGKYLSLRLTRLPITRHLVIHLRMSGDLTVLPPEAPAPRHARVLFALHDGRRLVFNDPRKFGRLWLLPDPTPLFAPLGPEPFDENLTPTAFHQRLQRHRRRLKPLLMDQRFLAGLGNIYADEALFLACLHPLIPAKALSEKQAATLLQAIRQVLREGIARNGTSIDWMYQGGNYQRYLRAYGRTGQPCPRCGTPIARIRVAQRSAHFCPVCQPPPED
ncbi:MAG TPA: DNA-formamidopyrimidine glycosylase [Anaerolineae bacterium]|nr:DNA-formamidopyrimidine glycosylase [Anaerolineae bacterium]HID84011.1 DNA-formamidopyrimidine glycosylase [Anaerolineales bacterium]HIQ09805.1 DNA-formamidopyrimidine glycosylase [Anaerolineaceae bacterium]